MVLFYMALDDNTRPSMYRIFHDTWCHHEKYDVLATETAIWSTYTASSVWFQLGQSIRKPKATRASSENDVICPSNHRPEGDYCEQCHHWYDTWPESHRDVYPKLCTGHMTDELPTFGGQHHNWPDSSRCQESEWRQIRPVQDELAEMRNKGWPKHRGPVWNRDSPSRCKTQRGRALGRWCAYSQTPNKRIWWSRSSEDRQTPSNCRQSHRAHSSAKIEQNTITTSLHRPTT